MPLTKMPGPTQHNSKSNPGTREPITRIYLSKTMRTQQQILKDIEEFRPADDNWLPLDDLLAELWDGRIDASCLRTLFELFERYPEEHGGGVLWGILHGVEAMDVDYEIELRHSLSRQPSHMAETMLRRLQKSKGG